MNKLDKVLIKMSMEFKDNHLINSMEDIILKHIKIIIIINIKIHLQMNHKIININGNNGRIQILNESTNP